MKMTLCGSKKGLMRSYIIPLLIVLFFSVLIVLAIFNLRITSKYYLADLIVRDVTQLTTILERIDQECKILDFDYQKNRINFLNVKTFVGSEVGPVNLTYPDKWKGPYMDDNPTYQDKEYQVVRTKKGYFVTPGEGVTLPNGKTIGKDIILDENADIPSMMQDENRLMFNGKPLAARLTIGITKQGQIYQSLPIEQI